MVHQTTSLEVQQLEQRAHDTQDVLDSQLDALLEALSSYTESSQPLTQQVDELLRAERNIQQVIDATERLQACHALVQQCTQDQAAQQSTPLKSALAAVRSNDTTTTATQQQQQQHLAAGALPRSLQSDPQSYIAYVHQLSDALTFLTTEASTYKGSTTLQRQCKELIRKAATDCQSELQRRLNLAQPLQLHIVTWPVLASSQYTVLPARDIVAASQLVQCMHNASSSSQACALIESQRSAWLRAALKQQAHDGYRYNVAQATSAASMPSHLTPGQISRGITADSALMPPPSAASSSSSASLNERIGHYVVGSHPSVFQWHLLLRLVQLEHQLLTQLLCTESQTTTFVPLQPVLSRLLNEPFAYFTKKQLESLKERPANKILHLYDLIETQHELLPKFETLQLDKSVLASLRELSTTTQQQFKRALNDYLAYIASYSDTALAAESSSAVGVKSASALSSVSSSLLSKLGSSSASSSHSKGSKYKQGSIYTLTIETFNQLRRLSEWRVTAQRLSVMGTLFESTSDPEWRKLDAQFGTEVSSSVLYCSVALILQAWHAKLLTKAKTLSKPSLSALFVLNNCHYLQQLMLRHQQSAAAATATTLSANAASTNSKSNAFPSSIVLHCTSQCTAAEQSYFASSYDRLLKDCLDPTSRQALRQKCNKGLTSAAIQSQISHAPSELSRESSQSQSRLSTHDTNEVGAPQQASAASAVSHLHSAAATSTISSSTRDAVKKRFSLFNQLLEELCSTQRNYSAPDSELRHRLRTKACELVVPLYSELVAAFDHVPFTKNSLKYIKYSPPAVEQLLMQLFDEEA